MTPLTPPPLPDWIKELLAEHNIPLNRVVSWSGYDAPTFANPGRVILDVEVLTGQPLIDDGISTRHVNVTAHRPNVPT